MALIEKFEILNLESIKNHSKVDATYSIINDDGKKYLQIDSYGSKSRQIQGGKSQSMRFSPEAITQLKEILKNFS